MDDSIDKSMNTQERRKEPETGKERDVTPTKRRPSKGGASGAPPLVFD